MGFFDRLFETKSNAPGSPVSRAVAGNGVFYGGRWNPVMPWDVDKAVRHGYERSIMVFRCVDAIATNASKLKILVREDDMWDGKVIPDSQINRILNHKPNIYESAKAFRYRLSAQALLSRKGVFIEIVQAASGRPAELHLLPPDNMTAVRHPTRFVDYYEIRDAEGNVRTLAPENVIWIKVKPHPTDPYQQMTPLAAAGLAVDTDYLARVFNRNFLANDGRPGMLVAVSGMTGVNDAEELRQRFGGNVANAGRTTVIEAGSLTIEDLAATPHDMQWAETISGSKEDIMLAFGTPESVLGNASGRTFANADAEDEGFWKTTMLDHITALSLGLDVLTPGGFNDTLYVAHDISEIDVLQRHLRERHQKALDTFNAGGMTLDEYLLATGRKPLNVPGSRVFWIAAGKVPLGSTEADTKAAAALVQVGQGAPVDPSAAAQAGAQQGIREGVGKLMDQIAARASSIAQQKAITPGVIERKEITGGRNDGGEVIEFKARRHAYEEDRVYAETKIGALLGALTESQARTTQERVGGVKARKGTRHWDNAGPLDNKALDAAYIVNAEKWADEVVASLEPTFREMAEKWAVKVARDMARAGIVKRMLEDGRGDPNGRSAFGRIVGSTPLDKEAFISDVVNKALDIARESAVRQGVMLSEYIAQMDRDGKSVQAIKQAITQFTNERSSWKQGLATSTTTAVIEGSRNAVMAKAGKYVKRKWMTVDDERVRASHRRADGQVRAGNIPFTVGGVKMMYPGDPTAPLEQVINCRCWTEFVPGPEPVVGRITMSDRERART